jgi:hypothetical protein
MALLRSLPLLLCACGLGAGSGGGNQNLPNGGTGPYAKLTDPRLETLLEEPFVITELAADLAEPAAVLLDDDTYRLWYSRTPRTPAGAATEIWTADLATSLTSPTETPKVALRADQPYEAGRVAAPAVIRDGEAMIMFYEAGTDLVARAVSADGGLTWTKSGIVLTDARQPSIIQVDGEWLLYVTRPSTIGIFVARSADGMSFTLEPTPVLTTGETGLDATSVGSPSAYAEVTVAGQNRVWLFYAATGSDEDGALAGIGYAGSEDGIEFTRGGRGDSALVPASAEDRSAAPLIGRARSVMFYGGTRANVRAIGAARTP